ncbi:hypothetical protein AADR41_22290 [Streptomyces sp. CLV115]
MQAHMKLATRGQIAPRVYFLDDTKGMRGEGAGRVIVGCVGPHLTNTLSS